MKPFVLLAVCLLLSAARVSAQIPTPDQVYDGLLQSIVPRVVTPVAPAIGSTGIVATAPLRWTGLWIETSTVYLSICSVTTAPPQVATNVVGLTWTPPAALQANTQYCWRVVGRNRAGASTNTAVWRFTTAAVVPPPPPPPPAPALSCPVNQSAVAPSASGIAVIYPPPTVTGGTLPVSVTVVPASGSIFPVGTTSVTATVTDAAARTATCTFTVTVSLAPPPPVNTITLAVPQTTVTCSPTVGPTLPLTAAITGTLPIRVEFVRDGLVMQTVTNAPWIMDWQLYCGWTQGGPAPGRPTTLLARRVDATSTLDSAGVTILVLDGTPPPPPPPPVAFNLTAQWDPNAPVDAVLDYELVVNSQPAVTVPPTLNAACQCIQAPPQSVPAGTHTVTVRARNVNGLSLPATVTVTRP